MRSYYLVKGPRLLTLGLGSVKAARSAPESPSTAYAHEAGGMVVARASPEMERARNSAERGWCSVG